MNTLPTTPASGLAVSGLGLGLNLQQLRLGYGRKTIIDGLSLALPTGTIGCLLGPSGCGKTTVLRAIAGFEPVQAGEVWLAGQRVSAPGHTVPPEQRRIGMVFQDHALFPHLSVAANVGFGLPGHPEYATPAQRQQRVLEMLDTVGLAHTAQRFPHELSGGQQQRIALARALAPSPRLMLLDEPFSSLDVELRERLGGELRALLKAAGTTALLVTHDQHEAFAIADEIGVMHQGRIQQWDSAYQLYHRPANRFVADFVGQGAFLAAEALNPQHLLTELGLLENPQGTWSRGQSLEVLLRPDDVVHDDDAPIRAKVLHKAFRGAEFLYTLALDSGAQVLSLVPSHHDHALGESIGIRLDLSHVVAYPRGTGSANTAAA